MTRHIWDEKTKRWIESSDEKISSCSVLEKEYQSLTKEYRKLKHGKAKDRLFEEKMKRLSQMGTLRCPQKKQHHSIRWHRCVHDVSKKGTAINPYAVCSTYLK